MGTYDTIWVPCPSCGSLYNAQTKGGHCAMTEFSLTDAPEDALSDVNRHAPFFCDCGCEFKVVGRTAVQCKVYPPQPTPDVSVSGSDLSAAMSEFTSAIEAKGWLTIGLRVEIVTICADERPYPTVRVEIRAWVV